MQKSVIYILDADRRYATQRIDALERKIQDLGPAFYDAFNQTSETWHDNAPFEAVRDRQSVLFAELQQLRALLSSAATSVPKQKAAEVGIGATVEVRIESSRTKSFFVAGTWSPSVGKRIATTGATVISTSSPLATELLKRTVNHTFEFNGKPYLITSIEYDDEGTYTPESCV